MKRMRAHRGFSLLELLVALVIVSMSLGLLYQASTGALRGVGDLDQQQRAGLLAQSILDARQAVPAAGWAEAGQAAGMDWRVTASRFPTDASRAAADVPALFEVLVSVEWPGRLGPRRLELRTLLPQERPAPAGKAP